MSKIADLMLMAAGGAGGAGGYWISLLGGSNIDQGNGVAIDSAGNIIAVGYTWSEGLGFIAALIAKYDSLGVLQWQRTLSGTGVEIANAVAIDSADNIIVLAETSSDGEGAADLLIAKYNSSGTLQWDRTLGSSNNEQGNGVAIDSADNIIVVGGTYGTGAGGFDALIAKYNSSGTLQWQRTLGGASNDLANGVAIDSADNIIIAAYSYSEGAGSEDSLIAKYNSSGTLQWQRTLGGSDRERFIGVAIDSADNVIAAGFAKSDGAGGEDILIAKYNSSGTLQWDRTLGGASNDAANGVAIDSADNIIVIGDAASDGAGGDDVLIAKYNSSGTLQWQRTLGGSDTDIGYAVAIDSADNIIVVGKTRSDGAGSDDVLIAKLPPDGSKTGTYGSLTYAEAVLTDEAAVLTDEAAVLTDAAASLTDAAAVLTDASASLTEELIEL